jgi:hypothetical protein
MKAIISRLLLCILILFLLDPGQFFILKLFPRSSGISAYFRAQTVFALDPDANSGLNVRPAGATTIRQTEASRWVRYDSGDKTDWLKVSPPAADNTSLIIHFNFLRITGKAVVEVYGPDPFAAFLEQREIERRGIYEYITPTVTDHYVKVYVVAQGNLAYYEFSYALVPLPSSLTSLPSTNTSAPTVTPIMKSTPLPSPTEVLTVGPISSPMIPLMTTPILTATHGLSKSDCQIIGKRYGAPPNLLWALTVISTLNEKTPEIYEVRKVVNSEQLKFLQKIARDTGRSISDFTGSSTGAMGPMQLMPATFYLYAQDGNGDGIKDPLNPYDNVATAAYFLARNIAEKNSLKTALMNYTNDPVFYEKILNFYLELEAEKELTSR